jgi:putative membrane protein
MGLILIVIAVIIIYFVLKQNKRAGGWINLRKETPMEILKTRYAKGEITKEEFERLKKEIES